MTQQAYIPDWSKAPPQANWWARDKDGSGFWYSKRPSAHRHSFIADGYFVAADNDCPFIDCSFELDNWRDTLTARPPQLCDIPQNLSDYFSGKTPFITAYVDLLLARMAKEERFSNGDDDCCNSLKPFDVAIFETNRTKNLGIVEVNCLSVGRIGILYNVAEINGAWQDFGSDIFNLCDHNFRTITELEAVEFRAAMEAVYG